MTGENTIILVAGMHRSGTSAFARVLNLLGVDTPGDLIEPAADNPRGFWENADIVAFHNRWLQEIGGHSTATLPFPEAWFVSSEAERASDELAEILRRQFTASPLSLVKDPRICRFLPLWYRTLDRLEMPALTVIPLRHPLNVAGSLAKRDRLPQAQGLLLWLEHVLAAESDSRGHRRVLCGYDDLVADWRAVADTIAAALRIEWPRSPDEAENEVDAFLTPKLRHHGMGDDAMDLTDPLQRRCADVWSEMIRLAGDEGDGKAGSALDTILDDLRAYAGHGAGLASDLRRALSLRENEVVEQRRQRDEWYEPELRRLQSARDERATLRRRVMHHAELAQRQARTVKRAEAQVDRRGAELARLRDVIAEYEKVKTGWFEPQLKSRFERIEWLEEQVRVLQARLDTTSALEKSRAFRVWRKLRSVLKLACTAAPPPSLHRAKPHIPRSGGNATDDEAPR